MSNLSVPRRELLLAPLLAALTPVQGRASTLDPSETILALPADIPWQLRPEYPEDSVASAPLFGSRSGQGIYYEQVVSRLHERAAYLRDRPPLRGRVRDLVGR